MVEIWIEENGHELHRQQLGDGQFTLGRSKGNEIYVPNPNVSRKHLRLDVGSGRITITDLGSTNGTQLNGYKLEPNQSSIWSPRDDVHIGSLVMHLETQAPAPVEQVDETPSYSSSGSTSTLSAATILCPEGVPQMFTLKDKPIFVGSSPSCAIRLNRPGVGDYHCRIELKDNNVFVTNLDNTETATLKGQPLTSGKATRWPLNESVMIGSSSLFLTESVGYDASAGAKSFQGARTSGAAVWLRRSPILLVFLAGFFFVCLAGAIFIGSQRGRCGGINLGCIFRPGAGAAIADGQNDGGSGVATPTLATSSGFFIPPTVERTLEGFGTPIPDSGGPPVECEPEDAAIVAGWLDLPFPYDGTAEEFRRISQRSRSGGRINSFFDHQYPIYPPRITSGLEPLEVADTLVLYNGTLSEDAFTQDDNSTNEADYYSGHAGIDFAPERPREPTTPVFAAAEGLLSVAKIDKDGNHMVWLAHDPDDDGRYDYATLYFHLHDDEHFTAMMAAIESEEPVIIEAGQRIGTMGTTGRSSGIHLHFEVRYDKNRDGFFSPFEKVDPYGYFPSEEWPDDPWALIFKYIDSRGEEQEHEGIASQYLWKHPLVGEVLDTGGDCQQQDLGIVVDLYPVVGYAVINSGFTYIARNAAGDVLREGPPFKRSITVLPERLEGVDIDSLSLELLDPKLNIPITITEDKTVEQLASGSYRISATIRKTGRYVLVAKEESDRVAPVTQIELSGDFVPGTPNTFRGSVTVTLDPRDRGEITSEIVDTQYSVDCGQTWNKYEAPFEVTLDTPHTCGAAGTGEQGVEFGPNDFIMLAQSEDAERNVEQPPAQVQFTIQ